MIKYHIFSKGNMDRVSGEVGFFKPVFRVNMFRTKTNVLFQTEHWSSLNHYTFFQALPEQAHFWKNPVCTSTKWPQMYKLLLYNMAQ